MKTHNAKKMASKTQMSPMSPAERETARRTRIKTLLMTAIGHFVNQADPQRINRVVEEIQKIQVNYSTTKIQTTKAFGRLVADAIVECSKSGKLATQSQICNVVRCCLPTATTANGIMTHADYVAAVDVKLQEVEDQFGKYATDLTDGDITEQIQTQITQNLADWSNLSNIAVKVCQEGKQSDNGIAFRGLLYTGIRTMDAICAFDNYFDQPEMYLPFIKVARAWIRHHCSDMFSLATLGPNECHGDGLMKYDAYVEMLQYALSVEDLVNNTAEGRHMVYRIHECLKFVDTYKPRVMAAQEDDDMEEEDEDDSDADGETMEI